MSAGHAPAPEHARRVRAGAHALPPRRVSGPARGPRAVPAPAGPPPSRWAEGLRALPDARWVDRLLRGRAWIALIGFALIGIVAMQVHVLKLNGGIGRAVEHAATLERQNAELRGTVAQLSSQERIQSSAAELGLVMPKPGDVRYVRAQGLRDARRAVKVMREPNTPAQVAAALAALAQQEALMATGGTTDPATGAAVDPATGAAVDPAAATATAPAVPETPAAPATTATADPAATATAPAPAATPDPAATPTAPGTTAPATGAVTAPAE